MGEALKLESRVNLRNRTTDRGRVSGMRSSENPADERMDRRMNDDYDYDSVALLP